MKLSYNWLKEYVDLAKHTPTEVGDKLTLHTCELEEVLPQKNFFDQVYTGKMIDRKDHPDADKLSIAQFDLGSLGTKQIIFGKVHEVSVGEILPIVIAGATLKSGIEIKDGDIRGVRSEGMIADNQELGMKNPGLIRFDADTPLGKSLPEVCEEFGDTLLDIDNKSLTHRPDLMGHRGFVRELGAIFEQDVSLEYQHQDIPSGNASIEVDIQTEHCHRFIGVRVNNVVVQPSPLEVQVRLENLEIRTISNLVDITNWILLEYGQPMHVFDADKVEGSIIVRQAKEGETLLALDEEEYILTPDDIVIADEKKVLSIAGIMGGLESGVTNTTTNVIFECANFDPVSIRKTSSRLGLRSESSMRFEKTLDPEQCLPAMQEALARVEDGTIQGMHDAYPQQPISKQVVCTTDFIRLRAGIEIEDDQIIHILTQLGFSVQNNQGTLTVQVPSWRATKDVAIAEDLVEEVVRLYGFDKVPSTLPTLPITPPQANELRRLEWKLRDFWSQEGYFEAKHYSFIPASDPFIDAEKAVTIANPLSEQTAVMRQTLLSRMLMDLENEVRTHGSLNLFEIGKIYQKEGDILPEQTQMLGILRSQINEDEDTLFYALKTDIEKMGICSQIEFQWKPLKKQTQYSHPGKSVQIQTKEGDIIGLVTVLHPSYRPLDNTPVVYSELNVEMLQKSLQHQSWEYKAPSLYPETHRDVSFIVDQKVLVGDIEDVLHGIDPLVTGVELFDTFEDDQKVGIGKKNLAFHIQFQSNKKTLEDQDIEQVWKKIIDQLENTFEATIRDA